MIESDIDEQGRTVVRLLIPLPLAFWLLGIVAGWSLCSLYYRG